MGKKKASERTRTMSIRVNLTTYRRIEQLLEQGDKPGVGSLSAMAAALIDEALRRRDEPEEQMWTRLLTHFEERIAEKLRTVNNNLRQSTGIILTPKKTENGVTLKSSSEIREWLDHYFSELPE